MTSTSSAHVTGLPSPRRAFLQQLATLPLIGSVAAVLPQPATAATAIEAAYREYQRLAGIATTDAFAEHDAKGRYIEPERPRYRMGYSEGGFEAGARVNGKYPIYMKLGKDNIAELQELIAAPPPTEEWEAFHHVARVKRAEETLAAIQDWRAERLRRMEACGLTAASEKARCSVAVEEAQRDVVYAMPSDSLQALAFKAALTQYDWDSGEVHEILQSLIEFAGIEA